MKTGYYIRYVPSFNEFAFYFYDGFALFVLIQPHYFMLDETFENYAKMRIVDADIKWQVSLQKEPCELIGFEFVCDEELNYEHSKETK